MQSRRRQDRDALPLFYMRLDSAALHSTEKKPGNQTQAQKSNLKSRGNAMFQDAS